MAFRFYLSVQHDLKDAALLIWSHQNRPFKTDRDAMAARGYVYILTNKPNGTLYVGVTSDPVHRIRRHKEGRGSSFAATYGLTRLVYIEEHETMQAALRREKRLKRWRRAWKLAVIREQNPTWDDRYEEVCEILAAGGRLP